MVAAADKTWSLWPRDTCCSAVVLVLFHRCKSVLPYRQSLPIGQGPLDDKHLGLVLLVVRGRRTG